MDIQDTLVNSNDKNNNNSTSASFDVAKEMVSIVLSAIAETGFEYKFSTEEKEHWRKFSKWLLFLENSQERNH